MIALLSLSPAPSRTFQPRSASPEEPGSPFRGAARLLSTAVICGILLAAASPSGAHGHSDASAASDTLEVTLSAPEGGTVAEGETGHFEVAVAGSTTAGAVTVRYSVSGTATAGVDYAALSGETTVAQGDSVARIALEALEDGVLDKGETVVLALTGATGPGTVVVDPAAATATIADNGTVTVSLTPVPDTVGEGSTWNSTVTMSTPVADRVSVRWWTSDGTARAGQDYRAANEVVSFQPGETSKPIKVQTLQDDDTEPVEVFYVSLDPPSVTTSAATANSVRVDAAVRPAFIECSVSFPPNVQTLFELTEPVTSGTVIGTVAAETTGGIPYYSLTGGQNKFAINSLTAEIWTTAALDVGQYHVTVTVYDECGAEASVDVRIIVKPRNRAPEFDEESYSFEAVAPVAVNGYVGTVSATDPDGDDVTYGLIGDTRFRIDGESGVIRAAQTLNAGTYSFKAEASDGELADTASVDVTVDVPPNRAPEFERQSYSFEAVAPVAVNGYVGTVSATDPDGDDVTYELIGDTRFRIDGESGVIRAAQTLNAGSYSFEAEASDGELADTASVDVTVDPRPNRAPEFERQSYSFEAVAPVAVNGYVGTVSATDPDGDDVTYELIGDTRFRIDGESGVIRAAQTLNAGSYSFEAEASDGELADTASVDVTVDPRPNRAPEFERQSYSFEAVAPVAVNGYVGTVSATDPDGDDVTYGLIGDTRFRIDGGSGVIRAAQTLNAGSYSFEAEASDGELADTASVDVTVDPRPNRAPEFERQSYSFEAVAPVAVNGYVGTVSATDPDGDDVTYGLIGDTRFRIDGGSGVIRAAQTLNAGSYSFEAEASDGELADTASVDVTVDPRPNRAPEFERQSYSFEAVAPVAVNGYVGTVSATDPDGDDVTYTLTGPDANRFRIDGASGVIRADEALDEGSYSFTARASDTQLWDTAPVSVEVVWYPDCVVGVSDQGFTVDRDETEAGTVQVSSNGSDCGALRYALSGADAAPFTIGESTGRVTVTGAVSVRTYAMTVHVRDSNNYAWATATLTIVVTEPPTPRPPVFGRASYSWEVHDTVSAGHVVGTVSATDRNGDPVTYSLSGTSRFQVDGASGAITVASAPVPADTYAFKAFATDPGGRADTAGVTVEVSTPPPTPNRAPQTVGSITARTIAAGEADTLAVPGYFNDPDDDALRYGASSSDAAVATASLSDSVLVAAGVSRGTATITVTATDPGNLAATQTFTVTVPNRRPVAEPAVGERAVGVGETLTLDLDQHFRDGDGDDLSYVAASSNTGVATVGVSGSELMVAGVSLGRATVTLAASDGHGGTAVQEFDVVVTGNRRPVTVGSIAARTVAADAADTLVVSAYFDDPDDEALTYGASSSDAALATASLSDSVLVVTGVSRGTATLTVTATDPSGLAAEQTFTVTVPNRAPVAEPPVGERTVGADETLTLDLGRHFRDDDGDDLSYVAASSNTGVATVGVSGSELAVTGVAPGRATVTLAASDGHGGSAVQEFDVVVTGNRRPVTVGSIADRTVAAGMSLVEEVSGYFNDPDGEALTYEASSADTAVAIARMGDRLLLVTGVSGGTATITVTATDPGGLAAEQTFTVTVPNRAPVAEPAVGERTVSVGGTLALDLDRHFRDDDGDELSYAASSSNTGVATAGVTGSELMVTGMALGRATVTVTASDGHGGTAAQSFDVAAVSANSAPVFDPAVLARSVPENSPAGTRVGDPVVAADADGGTLAYGFVAGGDEGRFAIHAETGQITVAEGAALNYESGEVVLTVRVEASDGELADTAAVTIRVTDVPVPPKPAPPEVASGPGQLEVSLPAPATADTRYIIQYREEEAVAGTQITLALGVRARTIKSLNDGTTYEVSVRARNPEGRSPWSKPTYATTHGAPVFGADAFERSVAENAAAGTAVGDPVAAEDVNGDALSYRFLAGADEGLFAMHAETGQIEVGAGAALDYEADSVLTVRVEASDGALSDTAAVTIRLLDEPAPGRPAAPEVAGGVRSLAVSWAEPANEGPAITGYVLQHRERDAQAWPDAVPVGDVLSHAIGGLNDGTAYEVRVRAVSPEGKGEWSEPGEGTTASNDPPAFGAAAFERSVAENAAAGTEVGEPVVATDPNAGDTLSYRFAAGGDEASFEIDAETGQIAVAESADLDYESGEVLYTVTVEASDGVLADTAAVTIRVTDVPAPRRPGRPEVTGGRGRSRSRGPSRTTAAPGSRDTWSSTASGAPNGGRPGRPTPGCTSAAWPTAPRTRPGWRR